VVPAPEKYNFLRLDSSFPFRLIPRIQPRGGKMPDIDYLRRESNTCGSRLVAQRKEILQLQGRCDSQPGSLRALPRKRKARSWSHGKVGDRLVAGGFKPKSGNSSNRGEPNIQTEIKGQEAPRPHGLSLVVADVEFRRYNSEAVDGKVRSRG